MDPLVITESDVKDQNLLLRFLRRVSQTIAALASRVDRVEKVPAPPTPEQIRFSLQATGSVPLRVDNLRGELAEPQKAKVVTFSSLPTGQILQKLSADQLVVVSGSSGDDIYRVAAGNPNRLVQLSPSVSGSTVSVQDNEFTIYDDGDNTRQLKFQASGITAGNTRTLTAPDYDGTIATRAGTETLTNKTLTSPIVTTLSVTSGGIDVDAGGVNIDAGQFTSASQFGARAYQSAAQAIADVTLTGITLTSESFDRGGCHDNAVNTTRMTVPAGGGGLWFLTGQITYTAAAAGVRQAMFYLNGATPLARFRIPTAGAADNTMVQVTTVYPLVAGDYVELVAYQSSGGALNTIVVDAGMTWFVAYRLC